MAGSNRQLWNQVVKSGSWSIKKYRRLQRGLGLGVKRRSLHQSIYHCCVQKTASQWFKWLLRDHTIYKYTGLTLERYTDLGLHQSDTYPNQIAPGHISAHLYTCCENYERIEKPASYRTIFVTRDPRDIVVSFYYSTKYSHPKIAYIGKMRDEMEGMNKSEGLCYVVDQLIDLGLFEAQRSWMTCTDRHARIFRYESLAVDHDQFIRDILNHFQILIPEPELQGLVGRHSFERRTKGRAQGEEKISSHYRKGVAGDWKNHLAGDTLNYFEERTGNLIDELGYDAG